MYQKVGVVLAILLLLGSSSAFCQTENSAYQQQVTAAQLMLECYTAICEFRETQGLPLDLELDPNMTGVIGDEFTMLTTSLVDLGTKRTSTNPDFAGLLVRYYVEAGLQCGDVVAAIAASGSYPALAIAALCAAQALELNPIIIVSIGSSTFGATLPNLSIADMLVYLYRVGLLPYELAGVSLGGGNDTGSGVLIDDDPSALVAAALRAEAPIIREPTLQASIKRRLEIYREKAGGRPIKCFVNIGAAGANMGYLPESYHFPNGLVTAPPGPMPSGDSGLIFHFASQGVPIIHLLNIRQIASENGLPFDPVGFVNPSDNRLE